MPLELLSKSLLYQRRPDGETSTLDLNAIFAQSKGVFVLGGSHFADSSLLDIRLQGKMLRATFSTKNGGSRDASIDLEACGIVRDNGLVCPPALTDEALNIKDTMQIRAALTTGRRSRMPSFANLKAAAKVPWLDCQLAEATSLFHLASIERLMLYRGLTHSKASSSVPRILPGLLEHDKRKYAAQACVDNRTGFVRNVSAFPAVENDKIETFVQFGRFIREAPSSRPRDWASIFETSRAIITDLVDPIRTSRIGLSPQIIEHLRAAERALTKSCRMRRAHDDLDSRLARRRARFTKRLETVADDLLRLVQPVTPHASEDDLEIETDEPEMCDVDNDEMKDPFWG